MRDEDLGDLIRRVANLIRVGTVDSANYTSARVRVKIGALTTDWLPWITSRSGGDRSWWAPEVGEQVVVLSPHGDLENGIVLPSVYREGQAPVASPTLHHTVYSDGTFIEYDRDTHRLRAHVVGNVDVTSDGSVSATVGQNLSATVTGNAAISANGNITANGATIVLNGGGKGGVVCQQHVCAFTGMPHPEGSGTVSAGN